MPRPPTPLSLTQLCIENLVTHMSSLWCPKPVAGRTHLPSRLHTEDLPAQLAPRIMRELIKRSILNFEHVNLLLNGTFRELDISKSSGQCSCDVVDLPVMKHLLYKAFEICPNIHTMNLSGLSMVPSMNMAASFPMLTCLHVGNYHTLDALLAALGMHATHLLELIVSNGGVTDAGLRSLVTKVDLGGKHNEMYGNCTKLKSIKFKKCDSAMLTVEGCTVLANNLPDLENFKCELAAHVAAANGDTTYKWQQLTLQDGYSYVPEPFEETWVPLYTLHLPDILAACPAAKKFSFATQYSLPDNYLLPLKDREVTKLGFVFKESELELNPDIPEELIRPLPSLSPLLIASGRNLETLKLSNVAQVNLGHIVANCPNLRKLDLVDVTLAPLQSGVLSNHVLAKLERLQLFTLNPEDLEMDPLPRMLTTEECLRLLASPLLRELKIGEGVTDEHFICVGHHGFQKLEKLEVSCHTDAVTMRSIKMLLYSRENPLREVCVRCDSIGEEDLDEAEQYLKETGLGSDIALECQEPRYAFEWG